MSVNTLQRAGTIFTLAFWNALFMLVCGMRFPQSFSKMVKLSIFCRFFGFFGISISIPQTLHEIQYYFNAQIVNPRVTL